MFKIDRSAIDIWSIPHFLSGIIIGIFALSYGYSPYESFAILLVLSLGCEVLEVWLDIKETRVNQVTDVLLALGAFFLGYFLFLQLSREGLGYVTIFSLCIALLVAIPGSFRYIKRIKMKE